MDDTERDGPVGKVMDEAVEGQDDGGDAPARPVHALCGVDGTAARTDRGDRGRVPVQQGRADRGSSIKVAACAPLARQEPEGRRRSHPHAQSTREAWRRFQGGRRCGGGGGPLPLPRRRHPFQWPPPVCVPSSVEVHRLRAGLQADGRKQVPRDRGAVRGGRRAHPQRHRRAEGGAPRARGSPQGSPQGGQAQGASTAASRHTRHVFIERRGRVGAVLHRSSSASDGHFDRLVGRAKQLLRRRTPARQGQGGAAGRRQFGVETDARMGAGGRAEGVAVGGVQVALRDQGAEEARARARQRQLLRARHPNVSHTYHQVHDVSLIRRAWCPDQEPG
mmetsp:Transcript_2240/g.5046  ORF Transcript_2240/g.5046 Transcript_2240/m.5046 type:complete len:334 (+) Transcript_2240:314-1315(+)